MSGRTAALLLAATLALPAAAVAQEHDHGRHAGHQGDDAPYAGLQERRIKALSADEVASLMAGEGMGFALSAELNGYPGPLHVLELADALELSDEQEARTRELFDAMRAEARILGEELVQRERALDEAFASGTVTAGSLEAALEELGSLRARLRGVHLRAHLRLTPLLTPEQRLRYRHLRGYVPRS